MVNDTFAMAIQTVLRHEGGFVDDPLDPGGATNFGISLRFLRSLGVDLGDFDDDGDLDEDDVKVMTQADAIRIYRREFWDRYRYQRLHPVIAIKVFDLSVNMGPGNAHRRLQWALHGCGERHVTVDGIIGAQTTTAVEQTSSGNLICAIRAEAGFWYRDLAREKPATAKYLKGWLNRAYS